MLRSRSPQSRGIAVNDTSLSRGRPERFRGAGLAIWLLADSTFITIGTGVSQWTDASGNGNNLTQATGANQPAYIASAVNGKPAVRFDGAGDFLGPKAFTWNQPEHLTLVYKSIVIGAASAHDAICDGNATGNSVVLSDTGTHYSIAAGVTLTDAEFVNNTTYGYTMHLFNGASSRIEVNRTVKASGNAGSNNAGGFTLGALPDGTRSTNVEVAEVIGYRADLSTSQSMRLSGYVKARYGL
jgi:hypothetical protein